MTERELIVRQREEIETLQERVRQLEDALSPPEIPVPKAWGLTPSEARIFAHLTTRDLVTKDSLMAVLYSDKPEEPDPGIVTVYVCKIRAKVRKFGVEIKSVYGVGYRLLDRHKYRAGRHETA